MPRATSNVELRQRFWFKWFHGSVQYKFQNFKQFGFKRFEFDTLEPNQTIVIYYLRPISQQKECEVSLIEVMCIANNGMGSSMY